MKSADTLAWIVEVLNRVEVAHNVSPITNAETRALDLIKGLVFRGERPSPQDLDAIQ